MIGFIATAQIQEEETRPAVETRQCLNGSDAATRRSQILDFYSPANDPIEPENSTIFLYNPVVLGFHVNLQGSNKTGATSPNPSGAGRAPRAAKTRLTWLQRARPCHMPSSAACQTDAHSLLTPTHMLCSRKREFMRIPRPPWWN